MESSESQNLVMATADTKDAHSAAVDLSNVKSKPNSALTLGAAVAALASCALVLVAFLATDNSSYRLIDTSISDLNNATNADFALPLLPLILGTGAGFLGIAVVAYYAMGILRYPTGTEKMVTIARNIQKGAEAFLHTEYIYAGAFLLIIFILCGIGIDWETAVCYLVGGIFSGLTGYIGMNIAVRGNVRTTQAASLDLSSGLSGLSLPLQVAFRSGAVMGLSVVAFATLGVSSMYLIFRNVRALAGFGAGSSTIALFARVGGGIYTKAADVGADLVGKVESDIPEDDPRNPATIADNVGDNVGDVAGMGADLFESFCGSIIAAAVLGAQEHGMRGVAVPFWIAIIGIVVGVLGTLYLRPAPSMEGLLTSIRINVISAAVAVTALILAVLLTLFDDNSETAWNLFGSVVAGLVAGVLIGIVTEYFTSHSYRPTRSIAESSEFGHGPVIIQGLGIGMISTMLPLALVVGAILASYLLGGFYGCSLASVGMLATLGVTMATDAYGPVADNAGGIAEMAELDPLVRERTDLLDALGNTTAATGKGFANGSAVLSALSLLFAFTREAKLGVVDVLDAYTVCGVLVGALLPYVFAALTMLAVGKSAQAMIHEVRRQFRTIAGLREGRPGVEADHERCVRISTTAALKEMIIPGGLAIVMPIAIGFLFGSRGLTGTLVGAISSGYLLGVMMSNAGGSWDNAKKYIESGGTKDPTTGETQGKGSEWHKAAVTGDTVGDPFKDTSGPSLNILIKLMTRFAFVFAPLFNPTNNDTWWIGIIVLVVAIILAVVVWRFVLDSSTSSSDVATVEQENATTKAADNVHQL